MLATALSGTPVGVEAALVRVEVAATNGLQVMDVVGLPEGAVREGKVRVQSALHELGFSVVGKRVTVNLGPADLRKEGCGFDLPIALALAAALREDIPRVRLQDHLILGELTLDGQVRPVRGVLPCTVAAVREGLKGVLVPRACTAEAVAVSRVPVFGVGTLGEALAFLRGEADLPDARVGAEGGRGKLSASEPADARWDIDLSDVRGQEQARRALEVAAAGGHNLLMVGPPGSGKSMLARRLTTILPPLGEQEALEVTSIYSVRGLLSPGQGLIRNRPFRAPHHTISPPALVGGGHGIPRPGELSLAHLGVLFLDELPEFRPSVTESLRQPLEDGFVTIGRSRESVRFPARVTLVGAMNPCPCGHHGAPDGQCTCTPAQVHAYRSRVSGPLLDRIDLHVEVPALGWRDLSARKPGEDSATVRARVVAARRVQQERFGSGTTRCNAHMTPAEIRQVCRLDARGQAVVEQAMNRFGFSARAHDRILKVARTIADLEGTEGITADHLAEAIQYRCLDRRTRPVWAFP